MSDGFREQEKTVELLVDVPVLGDINCIIWLYGCSITCDIDGRGSNDVCDVVRMSYFSVICWDEVVF